MLCSIEKTQKCLRDGSDNSSSHLMCFLLPCFSVEPLALTYNTTVELHQTKEACSSTMVYVGMAYALSSAPMLDVSIEVISVILTKSCIRSAGDEGRRREEGGALLMLICTQSHVK